MKIIVEIIGSEKFPIDCQENDTILQIKEKIEKKGITSQYFLRSHPSQSLEYAAKNNIRGNINCPVKDQRLVFRDSTLLDNQTVRGCGINNGNTIILKIIKKESDVIRFADVESTKSTKLNFRNNGPIWRKVTQGFNLFGICQAAGCQACGKEVICKIGFTNSKQYSEGGYFDLNEAEEKDLIKCPACRGIIDPKSYGFYKCEYQFVGKKIEQGKVFDYDSKIQQTNGDDFEYFNPDKSGKVVRWKQLLVYVFPKAKFDNNK